MRKYIHFAETDTGLFFEKLLRYYAADEVYCFFNSNSLDKKHGSYDYLMAAGVAEAFNFEVGKATEGFVNLVNNNNDWLCGFITYDLKNEIENLSSSHKDAVGMPVLHFFRPQFIFSAQNNRVSVGYLAELFTQNQAESLVDLIRDMPDAFEPAPLPSIIDSGTYVDKETYLTHLAKIKNHIQQGDIYEMNYCVEFFTRFAAAPDILSLYKKLNTLSPAPFSCLYKLNDKALVCASPERFLQKKGQRLMSQPIKGTIRRGLTREEDSLLAQQLLHSEKDRSENVMIVDLVRNDMSHYAQKASVQVEELFGIYAYAQVHQMVSTVVCKLKAEASPAEALLKCFPPGSMTGAPKIRAMQIIEDVELSKRGIYSGCVGFISPENDFDFNVVIRSIALNMSTCYASAMAGGAITALSDPQQEYEECLLKAVAMRRVLGGGSA